jgi:hypothetical protein
MARGLMRSIGDPPDGAWRDALDRRLSRMARGLMRSISDPAGWRVA